MKRYFAITALVLFLTFEAQAQWTFQAGGGYASPLTGYSTISSGGLLLQADIMRRPKKHPRLGIGLTFAWAQFNHDNNSSDKFNNAELHVVPIMLQADYELFHFVVRPYIGFGLGANMYNLTYDVNSTQSETISNVSFGMMPRLGIRFKILFVQPFLEVNFPMVMDGPPEGAGEADKLTGYVGYLAGLAIRI